MGDPVFKTGAPPFPFATIARQKARAFLLRVGVDPLRLGSYEGLGYLIRARPFNRALTRDLQMPVPFACIARRRPRCFTSQGRAATIYPAATDNAARSSDPDDVPADTYVGGYFDGTFSIEISLFSGVDPTQAGNNGAVGILEFDDPKGDLDGLRDLSWDNAPIAILRGNTDAKFSTWSVVANMTAERMLPGMKKKEIRLRDLSWLLQQAELHGLRYAGTGGEEGDAALAGIIKPYCIGQVFNIEPRGIVAAKLCYQVSCTSVRAITTVRDSADALAPTVDYPTYETLAAAPLTPTSGTYATCLARGLFRLADTPVGRVTADVQGDADVVGGLGYPSTRAEIARRIATGLGNLRLNSATQIDNAAYRALQQAQPAVLGYYWSDAISKAEALNEVMQGCLGWWFMRLDGRLAIGQLEDPAATSALFSLSYPSEGGTDEIRLDEAAPIDEMPPRRATLMTWARNYTQMTTDQIAGVVLETSDAVRFLAASRFTTSANQWVASNYPSSPVVTVNGAFAFEDDARHEGDRQQRLLSVPRALTGIPAALDPHADVVARVITIKELNRLGFGAASNRFCAGMRRDAGAMTTLLLWG